MNSKTRYYADAYGPDTKALAECIRKAFELADSDDEVERVVLYSYTKNNFMQVDKIFGANNVTQMFSCPMKFNECTKPIKCATFGKDFRPINVVQKKFNERPLPDEALCAVLWEYKDRGQKGYSLTETFFDMFQSKFPDYTIEGPKRAGADVQLKSVFPDYPNPTRPVDFVIRDNNKNVLAIGLARYDSDRGGAQEDDRTGGYNNCAKEILAYTSTKKLKTKVIFLNEGPGLLLGSMWDDYSKLEKINSDRIMVLTLRMLDERLTEKWLKS